MKGVLKLIMTICVVAMAAGCGSRQWRSYRGLTCGTACNISYRSGTDLNDSITSLLVLIEREISVFDTLSPVTALNRGESVIASDILRRAFEASKDIAAMSGGACDPTVGPLVELWGFGRSKERNIPSDNEIEAALATVGIAGCSITSDGVITKKSQLTQFNFGAIGKGLAAREIAQMLHRNGVTDCMVEIGGDVSLLGRNPRGTEWLLQIDAPVENDSIPSHMELLRIAVTDCGIATSGNYRNYRDYSQDQRYGHTINPATGRPVKTDVLSATVIAPDAAIADGLATACMVMGSGEALAMADRLEGVEIMLVTATDSLMTGSPWHIATSPGFPIPR